EPGRQHQIASIRQILMVGPVLIHDRQSLDAALRRPALRDVHYPTVEIAVLACDPLADRVGDDMRHPPPVRGLGEIGEPRHLLLGKNVPQTKFRLQTTIRLSFHGPAHECLSIDRAPIGEARARLLDRLRLLNEGAPRDRTEQTGSFEIGADHVGDVASDVARPDIAAGERSDRDRYRLYLSARDVDPQLRSGSLDPERADQKQSQGDTTAEPAGDGGKAEPAHQLTKSLGSNVKVMSCHSENLSFGTLRGLHL